MSLLGKAHTQRGLAGCSPRGHKESDMTSRLNNSLEKNFKKYSHFYFSKLNNPEKLTVWCMLPAGSPSAGAPMMAVKAFGASLPKWRYKEKLRVLLRRGCHQHPSVLTPWSWASSLQNHGKYIPVVCKPVSLWGLLQQPWGTKAHVGAPFPSVLLLFSH